MKVTFFGVRGTSPVTQPAFSRYGGDTTSLLVEGAGGEQIIIDAGTGLRNLGRRLIREPHEPTLFLLMTHYHLDHLIGLPSFAPLYRDSMRLTIASPERKGRTPEEVVSKIFDAPLWPLQIDTIPAWITFLTLPPDNGGGPFRRGWLLVRWTGLHHPGGATAYRIDEPATGASFVFATDVEWNESSAEEKTAFELLCQEPAPPELLVFDGQYDDRNYPDYRGWGHSTWQNAVDVAERVRAGQLIVTHHDPLADDSILEKIEENLTRVSPTARLGRQGMEVVLK
ncbi:MAG: MBL fold metallo-hydrolase [PVC group bacterium]